MLVNIDIRLSILVSKWAPSGRKFALGSSCSTLALGYYNVIENCWVVSKSKNFTKSPITTLSFHPSCNILAFGSADYSIKIVTVSFKQTKEDYIIQSKVEDYPYEGPFAGVNSLFEVLFSI
jgi:actin related protein 2/3 complex subunit 1A/1B